MINVLELHARQKVVIVTYDHVIVQIQCSNNMHGGSLKYTQIFGLVDSQSITPISGCLFHYAKGSLFNFCFRSTKEIKNSRVGELNLIYNTTLFEIKCLRYIT